MERVCLRCANARTKGNPSRGRGDPYTRARLYYAHRGPVLLLPRAGATHSRSEVLPAFVTLQPQPLCDGCVRVGCGCFVSSPPRQTASRARHAVLWRAGADGGAAGSV